MYPHSDCPQLVAATPAFWAHPKGYFSMERKTMALLAEEAPSVAKLFYVIVSQAHTYCSPIKIAPERNARTQLWEAGSRGWSLRDLAAAAHLSVPTIRRGLQRLRALKLVHWVSGKLGTVIQVLRFFEFRRRNPNADRDAPALTRRPGTPREKSFNYKGDPTSSSKTTESIHVSEAARLSVKRLIGSLFHEPALASAPTEPVAPKPTLKHVYAPTRAALSREEQLRYLGLGR